MYDENYARFARSIEDRRHGPQSVRFLDDHSSSSTRRQSRGTIISLLGPHLPAQQSLGPPFPYAPGSPYYQRGPREPSPTPFQQ